jgi:hypothetical protein
MVPLGWVRIYWRGKLESRSNFRTRRLASTGKVFELLGILYCWQGGANNEF